MATDVPARSLFSGPDRGLLENVVLRHDNGVITDISAGAPPATSPRSLVLPAFVNAHDHARPTASSFGALGMPLESWILRSALGTPVDPYLTAASALARSARAGCAAMMIHYTRPSGVMPLVEEASAIVEHVQTLTTILKNSGLTRDKDFISRTIEGAQHNEKAWAARFGDVLQFFFASSS